MTALLSSSAASAESPDNSHTSTPLALVLGGGTGMLGQALVNAALSRGWNVRTLGRENGPVTDPAFLEDALGRMNPDYIFNGIAYTAVDLAESERKRPAP